MLVLALVLVASPVSGISPQYVSQGILTVRVIDQLGKPYDGVSVDVYRGELLDHGVTKEGTWYSINLPAEARLYNVTVSNGDDWASRLVELLGRSAYAEFQLVKRAPSPALILANVTFAPSAIFVGDEFHVEFLISNVGELDAKKALATFTVPAPLAIVGSGSAIGLGDLKVGGNVTASLKLLVGAQAAPGTYVVEYEFEYSDENEYSYTSGGNFGVTILGISNLQIDSISIDPPKLVPGTDGFLTIQLINVGTERATDVVIRILDAQDILTTSTNYVGEIKPKDVATQTFGIHVKQEATEGLRAVNVTVGWREPFRQQQLQRSWILDLQVFAQEPFIPYIYFYIAAAVAIVAVGMYVAAKRLGY